ncbi:MAG TPA: hypothetical protein VFS71_17680 [Flavobacterium sp.]|nr:hypothetical protein [Flavobacterium sp.]HEU4791523.1 hypothetical protein [Flavobacterium sp.]
MKLSLNALKEKAESTVTGEILSTIKGGMQNDCHVTVEQKSDGTIDIHVY